MNFYNDVNDWLSVGGDLDLARDLTGQDFSRTIKELQAHGVTHVLDLRIEWHDLRSWVAEGLPEENYAHIPITDSFGYQPPAAWFTEIENFVGRFLDERAEGDRIYVHCHMGINRAPSAAMAALLVADPTLDPFDAFLTIRAAREQAGLVYAEAVGTRHIAKMPKDTPEDNEVWRSTLSEFQSKMKNYWTPELRHSVHRGIAYYRAAGGGTLAIGREA